MKKILTYLLVCMMIIGLVGCGKKSEPVLETQEVAEAVTETTTEAITEAVTEAVIETVTETLPPERYDYTIGFCGVALNDERNNIIANAVKKACEDKGTKCIMKTASSDGGAAEQVEIIRSFIAEGVNGIILVPASSQELVPALQECISANIPIVNLDKKIANSALEAVGRDISFYGTDNYVGGQLVGKLFKEQFPEDGTQVAILRGISGESNDDDRYNGFKNKAGNIEIVFEEFAEWDADKAYTAIQNCLKENPELQAIYCENDLMGLGASKAVSEAGLKDKVKIFSFGGATAGIQAVSDGSFVSTCAERLIEMGNVGVSNMLKLCNGRDAENYVDTGCEIITATNAADTLKTIKEYMSEIVLNNTEVSKTVAEETVEVIEETTEEIIEETTEESVEETTAETAETVETTEVVEETEAVEETTLNAQ